MSGNSGSCMVMVPGDLTAALHARSRDMDVTLFVTLLSAYALLLADFAGQRDMVIGTPVRGRNSSEVEGLMGYFTNLLPLRMEIDPAQPFSELVRKVRDVVLDSFSAPDIRLEDLTRERSEEHTSELQSLMRISYAVFCLTKKTQARTIITSVK